MYYQRFGYILLLITLMGGPCFTKADAPIDRNNQNDHQISNNHEPPTNANGKPNNPEHQPTIVNNLPNYDNDKDEDTRDKDSNNHDRHLVSVINQEYMSHINHEGIYGYQNEIIELVKQIMTDYNNAFDQTYVYNHLSAATRVGSFRVIQESERFYILQVKWTFASSQQDMISDLMTTKTVITILSQSCSVSNDTLQRWPGIGGEFVSMPSFECNCKQFNVSKNGYHIQSQSECNRSSQWFSLHVDSESLPELEYITLIRLPMLQLITEDILLFPKLKLMSLEGIPLTYHALSDHLLCSLYQLVHFDFNNSFSNLKTFPSHIFDCDRDLQLNSISFRNHDIQVLPAMALKSAARNVKVVELRNVGLMTISSEAFVGMNSVSLIMLVGNPLFSMSCPYSLLPSIGIYLSDNQSNGTLKIPLSCNARHVLCSKNNIKEVDGESFCCPNSTLKVISLKQNQLQTLTASKFRHCLSLQFLILSDNDLVHFELPKLTQLQHLNLAENALTSNNPWSFLAELNDLHYLNISRNNLTAWLQPLSTLHQLQEVDLSHNKISVIAKDVFQNLSSLEFIDLSYNTLTQAPMMYHLVQLSGLNLGHNALNDSALMESGVLTPFVTCSRYATIIDLSFNKFKAIHISHANKSQFVCGPKSIFAEGNALTEFTLACPPQYRYDTVTVMHNSLSQLYNIFPDPLESQCHINVIDLSYNPITDSFFTEAVQIAAYVNDVRLSSDVTHYIGELILQHCDINILLKDSFVFFKMNYLDLQYNSLTAFAELNIPGPSSPIVNVTHNPLLCTCSLRWLKNHLQHQQQQQIRQHKQPSNMIIYIAPPCLATYVQPVTQLDIMTVDDRLFICSGECLTDMKASCYKAFCYTPNSYYVTISALVCQAQSYLTEIARVFVNVKYVLTLYGANIHTLHLPYEEPIQLQYLKLDANNITVIPDFTFRLVPLLQILGLANNKIIQLSAHTFHNLSRLNMLDLSQNKLVSIDSASFRSLRSLQVLYLHDNLLSALDAVTLFTPLGELVNVTLYDNPWACGCNDTMRPWIIDHNIIVPTLNNVTCKLSGELVINVNVTSCAGAAADEATARNTRQHSNDKIILGGTISGVLLLIGAALCLIYKYRFYISVLIVSYIPHRLLLMLVTKKRSTDPHQQARQGMFVIYDDQDVWARGWVKNELVARLELEWPVICYDKDFLGGLDMADNIQAAVNFSQCAVLLVSQDFIHNHWSVKMALAACTTFRESSLREPYRIIPILTDGVKVKDVILDENCPQDVVDVLRGRTLRTSDRLFWQSLKYLLPARTPRSTPLQPGAHIHGVTDESELLETSTL